MQTEDGTPIVTRIVCEPCSDTSGAGRPASWICPQSLDRGRTTTWVPACDYHHQFWWDGSNWIGRSIPIPQEVML